MAAADGEIHDLERRLAAGIQRHILGTDEDFEALGPVEPGELAAGFPAPFRERVVHGCLLVALIDGEASRAEMDPRRIRPGAERSRLLLYNDRCTLDLVVRRTDLERRLKALGWAPTSKASGKNHRVWAHPKQEFELYIPQYDLIPDAVGQRILEDAGD